jgi:TetR/AcrR family transcriptional regulator, acrAB operon repressor
MARRTKEEAQETRSTIMMEALGLFCQQGVATTSLSDIARAAGVTRGAIYWHFKDKEELFLALWHEMCAPLSHLMNASIDVDEPDPLGKFTTFLIEVLRTVATCSAHQQMFRIMFKMMLPDSELSAIRALIREEIQQHTQNMRYSLSNAVRRGQLPSTLPVERAAVLLHCAVDGLIINWLNQHEQFDLAGDAEALVRGLIFSLQHNLGQP